MKGTKSIWPDSIFELLKRNYDEHTTIAGGSIAYTIAEKECLVNDAIQAYKLLPTDVLRSTDALVPASPEYLEDVAVALRDGEIETDDFEFKYKWPSNEGFDPAAGARTPDTFKEGVFYDRIGSPYGHYLAPFTENDLPLPYIKRALPYYIPEDDFTDNPAYHLYRAKCTYQKSPGEIIESGTIAPAFAEGDGRGKQLYTQRSVRFYMHRVLEPQEAKGDE